MGPAQYVAARPTTTLLLTQLSDITLGLLLRQIPSKPGGEKGTGQHFAGHKDLDCLAQSRFEAQINITNPPKTPNRSLDVWSHL